MAGVFVGTNTRYSDIGPAGSISYPTDEWTILVMFYLDPAAGRNSQDYIYGHGQPSAGDFAVNISVIGPGGTGSNGEIRCRVESTASVKLLDNTSNAGVDNAWNAFALVWDGSNFKLFLNGVQTTHSPLASYSSTITPTTAVRIGQRDDLSSTRSYHGRICHIAQLDRDMENADGQRYTNILISPDFAQEGKLWHVAMWNADFNFDQQNAKTVTDTGMVFGDHAQAVYPCMVATNLDEEEPPAAVGKRVMYVSA